MKTMMKMTKLIILIRAWLMKKFQQEEKAAWEDFESHSRSFKFST